MYRSSLRFRVQLFFFIISGQDFSQILMAQLYITGMLQGVQVHMPLAHRLSTGGALRAIAARELGAA